MKRNLKRVFSLMLLVLFLTANLVLPNPLTVYAATQAEYYVDPVNGSDTNPGTLSLPFKTITKARDAVSQISDNMTGNIIIYLRGGRHELTGTLVLNSNDSGTNSNYIMYRNYPDESPVISGGKKITGWIDSDSDGIYEADVDDGFIFRQLYVDNKWAYRAMHPNIFDVSDRYSAAAADLWLDFKYPNSADLLPEDEYKYFAVNNDSDNDLNNWSNITDIELVTQNFWMQYRGFLNSYTINTVDGYIDLQFDNEYGYRSNYHQHKKYHWENAFEFIDAGGEW